jgi:hypothetical protein
MDDVYTLDEPLSGTKWEMPKELAQSFVDYQSNRGPMVIKLGDQSSLHGNERTSMA